MEIELGNLLGSAKLVDLMCMYREYTILDLELTHERP